MLVINVNIKCTELFTTGNCLVLTKILKIIIIVSAMYQENIPNILRLDNGWMDKTRNLKIYHWPLVNRESSAIHYFLRNKRNLWFPFTVVGVMSPQRVK